ncbi:YtzI protein [Bacillus sp. M6-12]|uniref:YtzI protein n=1 Tax=Bacillus sp. M6-12 TaxID=2054166 RepID=UPI000C75AA3B|nr:YtzI protein [Bacillus sp. M6-12]PLS14951.1 YtzI protein [Bacillus sp. M6-12]
MMTIMIISIIIVLLVLLATVLTIGKAYKFQHSVDQIDEPPAELSNENRQEER